MAGGSENSNSIESQVTLGKRIPQKPSRVELGREDSIYITALVSIKKIVLLAAYGIRR